MKVTIRQHGVALNEEGRAAIERRLQFALARFGASVSHVGVYLADLNGPKGGIDKSCRLVARLAGGELITVEDRDAHLAVLVGRTVERLDRQVRRTLDRKRPRRAQRVVV